MRRPTPTSSPPTFDRLPVWRLLDLGRCPPERAQAFAEAVARSVAENEVPNTLLLAQPSAPYVSLGFHQSFAEEIDPEFCDRHRLPVLRRVEGGGTTYLDPDQWFYQLVYRDEDGGPGGPADLARFLAAPVRAARELGLMARLRPPSDLVVGDRKLSGNAGGDWDGAHLVVGGFLGRTDPRAMADLLRLPHPAVRPLLRHEVERWVTSWEAETGRFPSSRALREGIVAAFRAEGLFEARPGRVDPAEESRFRTETLPRHRDPGWRELPPLPRPTGAPLRRIRVAGPHGLLVLEAGDGDRLWAAVVDGAEVREAYRIRPGADERLDPVSPGSPERDDLERAVHRAPRFD